MKLHTAQLNNDITTISEHGSVLTEDPYIKAVSERTWQYIEGRWSHCIKNDSWGEMGITLRDVLIVDPTKVPAEVFDPELKSRVVGYLKQMNKHNRYSELLVVYCQIFGISPVEYELVDDEKLKLLLTLMSKEISFDDHKQTLQFLLYKLRGAVNYMKISNDMNAAKYLGETTWNEFTRAVLNSPQDKETLHFVLGILVQISEIWPERFASLDIPQILGCSLTDLLHLLSQGNWAGSDLSMAASLKLLLSESQSSGMTDSLVLPPTLAY